MLNEEEIARRLPVFGELGSLFLDTDYIGIVGPRKIAERISAGGYGADEVEQMLFDEVMPALPSTCGTSRASGLHGIQTSCGSGCLKFKTGLRSGSALSAPVSENTLSATGQKSVHS
nr:hypothetical protein [uncultured Sphingomonas sp.]